MEGSGLPPPVTRDAHDEDGPQSMNENAEKDMKHIHAMSKGDSETEGTTSGDGKRSPMPLRPTTSPPIKRNAVNNALTSNGKSTTHDDFSSSPSPISRRTQHPSSPAMKAKAAHLESQIANLEAQLSFTRQKLSSSLLEFRKLKDKGVEAEQHGPMTEEEQIAVFAEAEATVKQHIKLLHEYNEIKDIGMGLCGLIADGRGVRLQTILDEYDVLGND